MWGLSNGAVILSVSATFWMALAAWTLGPSVLLIAAAPLLLISGFLIRRGYLIRRWAAGFSRASLRTAPKGSSIQRIGVAFNVVGAAQTLGIATVVFISWKTHRPDLLWPLIGLVISIHFLPLGWIFSLRPYYVLGALGIAVAGASILGFTGSARTVAVGVGLGLVIGGCVAYLIANAEALADQAVHSRPSPADAVS